MSVLVSYPELEADQPLHTSAAEENVAALEKTLASRGDDAKGEAEVRRQLVRVQKELDKYRAVYGDASSLPPETAQLSEQLQRKQDELDRLQLQDKQREQAETAIYSELDKLSAAWESLEKQLKKKVYDLSAADERIGKVNLEVCVPATSSAPRDLCLHRRKPRRRTSSSCVCATRTRAMESVSGWLRTSIEPQRLLRSWAKLRRTSLVES